MEKSMILIDTDIGDDIDDAFAIALALKSKELDLVGITTVFRNSVRRAKISKALLQRYGREDIPVFPGIDVPLTAKVQARENDKYDNNGYVPCQYMDFMDCLDLDLSTHAVDFIIKAVRENPGELNIVPIGPLTNIAVAIRKAPDIVSKIKSITLMGGYFQGTFPEWNILCDPEAARIVFTSGANINAVGLDITSKCELLPEKVELFKKLSGKCPQLISQMMEKWFEHYNFNNPVLHDPLTVGTLIDPTFVKFEKKSFKVILEGKSAGITAFSQDSNEFGVSQINIGVEVDAERYLDFFISRVFE